MIVTNKFIETYFSPEINDELQGSMEDLGHMIIKTHTLLSSVPKNVRIVYLFSGKFSLQNIEYLFSANFLSVVKGKLVFGTNDLILVD